MAAYWIARGRVHDPVRYKLYADRVPGIIAAHGGRILARGGRFQVMEGNDRHQRFVVIEFPSLAQAVACHESPEYREAAAFRRHADVGEVDIAIVESLDAGA